MVGGADPWYEDDAKPYMYMFEHRIRHRKTA